MANADPGEIFDGGADTSDLQPFMSGDKKRELSAAGTPLYILGATPKTQTQYGDQTYFHVGVSQDDQYLLAMGHNPIRERQARSVLALLENGSTTVGPVYLVKVPTKSGNPAWALTGQKDQAPAAVAPVQAALVTNPDDGIPF